MSSATSTTKNSSGLPTRPVSRTARGHSSHSRSAYTSRVRRQPVRTARKVAEHQQRRKQTLSQIVAVSPINTQQSGTHSLALNAIEKTQSSSHRSAAGQRSDLSEPTAKRPKIRRSLVSLNRPMRVFVLLLASILGIQTVLLGIQYSTNANVLGTNAIYTAVDSQGIVLGSGTAPAEGTVNRSALDSYRVANSNDPRYIRIPLLGVEARVKPLSERNGVIDSPGNINDAGWYTGSVRPGSVPGSSLIIGHVKGLNNPGIFSDVSRLVPGSIFEIELGNGSVVNYEVVRTVSTPYSDMDIDELLTSSSQASEVKLITSTSTAPKDRVVIHAELIK